MDHTRFSYPDYRAWAEPAINKTLREQQAHFEPVLGPLREIGLVKSYLNDTRGTSAMTEPKALHHLGALAAQMAIGIHASLSTGAPVVGAIAFRPLFEVLLSIKLIRQADPQARSDLYMNYEKVLRWDHLEKQRELVKHGHPIPDLPPPAKQHLIDSEYQSVADAYPKRANYWWSQILWTPEEAAKSRPQKSTKAVAQWLDAAGVPTGLRGATFEELNVRWYSTFSIPTHVGVLATNQMLYAGGRHMGFVLNEETSRLSGLAAHFCAEAIAECEEGLGHPKSGWARMFLRDLSARATAAAHRLGG